MLFSVVIPLFNKSAYIERCLRSIHGEELEIIVVDDFSSDDSREVVQRLNIPELRLISLSRNHGPAFCRNLGIQEAKGEFVVFLDADDYLDYDYFRALREAIELYPTESVFAANLQRIKNSKVEKVQRTWGNGAIEVLPRYSYHLWASQGKFLLSSSSAICRRSLLLDKFLFNESMRYGEDPELWVRISCECSIVYVKDALVVYDTEVSDSVSKNHIGMIPVQLLEVLLLQMKGENFSIVYNYYRNTVFKIVILARIHGKTVNLKRCKSIQLKGFDKVLLLGMELIPIFSYAYLYKIYRYFK